VILSCVVFDAAPDFAEEAALDLLAKFDADGTRAAHPAIIYGPDLGTHVRTIA
jgi:hypothetical protein